MCIYAPEKFVNGKKSTCDYFFLNYCVHFNASSSFSQALVPQGDQSHVPIKLVIVVSAWQMHCLVLLSFKCATTQLCELCQLTKIFGNFTPKLTAAFLAVTCSVRACESFRESFNLAEIVNFAV